MSFGFEYRDFGAKGVLQARGSIDSAAAAAFETALFEALDRMPEGGVVVDCAALEYVSSAGLRVLLMGAKRQRKAGRPFAVCNLSDNIARVFTMGGFGKIVAIYPTLDDVP